MSERRPFTITRARIAEAGYPEAYVAVNGSAWHVDRRYGSWQADVRPFPGARTTVRRDVLPHVARELQAAARRLERRA